MGSVTFQGTVIGSSIASAIFEMRARGIKKGKKNSCRVRFPRTYTHTQNKHSDGAFMDQQAKVDKAF